jgi:glutathione S-transferase/3-isopropylmalate dehydratase
MITVFGGSTSRSLRVVWLMEEMGIGYRIRPVDMLSGQEDREFLEANPAGFIPVIRDGDVTMVESIAIMEYLMGRYGPTPLAPAPADPAFPAYQQFLHLGEAGLATFMNMIIMCRYFAPESERDNWAIGQSRRWIEKRMRLVKAQLARTSFIAGERFTAADISLTYALHLGTEHCWLELDGTEQDYFTRMTGRAAWRRALETSVAAFPG